MNSLVTFSNHSFDTLKIVQISGHTEFITSRWVGPPPLPISLITNTPYPNANVWTRWYIKWKLILPTSRDLWLPSHVTNQTHNPSLPR
jgi:hypothetical protein